MKWNDFKNWVKRKLKREEKPLHETGSAPEPGIDPHGHLTHRQYTRKMKNRKRNKVSRKSRRRNRK